MSLALYRKYRSKSFNDVVGQAHITSTLKNSIDNKTFSHAYLLTGLRGVGKTSVARIFAAYVNEVEYQEVKNNPDIIEIDAASNRKIDEVRDLREKVNIAPTNLKYKVYIIDEVHMLTREAFNALLKTLEEPPEHCILILATTDYHKLPETIISRCLRFSFKAIAASDIAKHLGKIAKKEKIKIDREALDLIAKNSSGSLRDAITVLDQARNMTDNVTVQNIELLLGLANTGELAELYNNMKAGDASQVESKLNNIQGNGADPEQLINQLSRLLREKVYQDGPDARDDLDLLKDVMEINNYSDKWLALEVCILKHALGPKKKFQTENLKKETLPEATEKSINVPVGDTDLWDNVLSELKKSNSTLYGVARMAEANADNDVLELRFKFNFHKKQLDIKHNQVKIIEIANKHNRKITTINTVMIKENDFNETVQNYDSANDISNISNVFGSAEMLE